MRHIKKQGAGGFHLQQAHGRAPQTAAEATTRWARFGPKPALLQCLLDEQFHLCCYSELRADEEGLGYHIEHVENKSQNPARCFDYGNLAASALDSNNGLSSLKVQGEVAYGGHAAGKQDAVDMSRFISPHRANCPRFFSYLSDGRVVPASALPAAQETAAQYTIDLLNLNSPFLVLRRRQWWDELDGLFQEHMGKGWSLADLIAVDLVPHDNKLSRFFSLTRQFFGAVAEQTLHQRVPALL